MRPLLTLLALSLFATAPAFAAQPDPGLVMTPGEAITVRIDGATGAATVLTRGPVGSLSEFDQAAIEALTSGAHDYAVGPKFAPLNPDELGVAAPAPVAPDVVRLLFFQAEGGDETMLIIENGYEGAFAYRATMHVGTRETPTDVCQVMPERRGYEHWPYAIDRIELTQFRLEAWNEGQGLRCE